MPETTHYILDGQTPVICHDETTWKAFINNPELCKVAFDEIGHFTVSTVFAGVNLGTEEEPKFFATTFDDGSDEIEPPLLTKTWDEAVAKHDTAAKASIRLYENAQSGGNSPKYRFTSVEIENNEVQFTMESEETASAAIGDGIENWTRDGKTLTFSPTKKPLDAAEKEI